MGDVKVKKWTQLRPEDFTNGGMKSSSSSSSSSSSVRRHSAPADEISSHVSHNPHHNKEKDRDNGDHEREYNDSLSLDTHSRFVFHHHPYMSTHPGKSRLSSSSSPTHSSSSPTLREGRAVRRASNATLHPPPCWSPLRRLSLPHPSLIYPRDIDNNNYNTHNDSYNNQQHYPNENDNEQYQLHGKLYPLLKIVEEDQDEMENARESFAQKKTSTKMSISNLVV